ncbi:MAG: hypothetical protein HDR22_01980 [Lachnospiraceae bacterium]|nr:hypothetical protein [Lachnospiraceae bacterium]
MHKVCQVAKNGVYRTLTHGRFYFALFINLILIKQLTDSIRNFSEAVRINASPWLFPFLMQQSYIQFLFLAGATLLFCDAPFIEEGSSFEMIRAGKKKWIAGKLLYMISISFLYTTAIMLLTIFLLFPRISFQNNWGKVLGTLAQTNAAEVFGNNYISLDYRIILKYEPIEAMVFSFLIAVCVCFIVGLCVLTVNLCFKKVPGALGGITVALMSYFQKNFSNLYAMSFFSPASWMDIALWNRKITLSYPSVNYMVTFLILSIFILCVFSMIVFWRLKDVLNKKGEY